MNLLRQIEVGIANGKTTPQARKEAEITQQTYYRWRREHGGLKLDQAEGDAAIRQHVHANDDRPRIDVFTRIAGGCR